jgi:GPH family glycoside/pentoside/hexuronide:cation symporter
VRISQKLGYGVAEVGITAVQIMTQIYLLKFYTEFVGLKPSLAGIALSISVIWDAVSDPIMGVISDETRTKWGKRRPFLLMGGILLAFSFAILFSPPKLETQFAKFMSLLVLYLITNTAMTILSVPHISLGGELTEDRHERTSLYGIRLFFSNLGMMVGMGIPAILLSISQDENSFIFQYQSKENAALIISGIVIITSVWTFLSTEERPDTTISQKPSVSSILVSLFSVMRNKAFLPLLFAFLIATLGRTLNTSIALYYYEFRLHLKESEVVSQILFPFFFFILLSIGFWIWISKKFGKKIPAFLGGLGLGIMTIIVYPLLPVGEIKPPLIAAFFGGIFAGAIFLYDSVLSDIIDYDRLKTGMNREGLYFGFWKMGTKLSQAIGLALLGFILEGIGFEPGQASGNQDPELGMKLAWLFGPGVGSFFVVGSLIFLWMPITDSIHVRIQKILKQRPKKRLPNLKKFQK